MKIKIRKLIDIATIPSYAHPGDSGLDLCAIQSQLIPPGNSILIPTGLSIEIPFGLEAQVRPRSGLALKHQITVLNTPGTIDSGYRGEIGVILVNHGKEIFVVEPGMKIAQLVITPVLYVAIEEICEPTETLRGQRGFGSSGI